MRRAVSILLSPLALLAAGCGGSSDDATGTTTSDHTTSTRSTATVGADGCSDVTVPAAREDGGATEPKERLDPEKTYELVFKTNCGSFTVTLDQAQGARHGGLARLAREGGLLRRHDLPPDRARLRDPGRRPDPGRERRARLPDRRSAAGRLEVHRGRRRDGQDGRRASRDVGQPVLRRQRPERGTLPPDYAIVGNVTSGMDTVKRIDGFGDVNDPNGAPTRPVVIESVTVEES